MATDEFDRWFILASADAMGSETFSTEEILEAHRRGVLRDRTVIYHRYASRRDAITVKELVDRVTTKK